MDLYGAPPQTAAVAAAPTGISQLTKLVMILGVVVIVAIAGLWFFWLRDASGGGPFAGTWKSSVSATKVSITRSGAEYSLYTFDNAGKKSGPFTMTANGESLECNLTPLGGSANEQAATEFARSMLGSMTGISDFKFVFTPGDKDGVLVASFGGTATNAQGAKLLAMREELKRD
jgi:hypothetical protein